MSTRFRFPTAAASAALLASLLAGMLAAAAGCDGGGPGDDFDARAPIDPGLGTDTVPWDPGNPGTGCGGYGYGYGPDCVPPGALDCTQDPCIFGTCRVVGGAGACECLEGYAGRICGECAEGWVARGLRCVPANACDAYPCVFGTCRILNAQPFCDCDAGYTGDACDRCAEGYRAQDLRCVKEGE